MYIAAKIVRNELNTMQSIPRTVGMVRMLRGALLLATPLLWYSTQAHAECSRSDIDYYLDKGFTQAQVTALCSGDETSSRRGDNYEAYDDPVERYAREVEERRRSEESIYFIKSALVATNIEVTPEKLEYTRRFCIVGGNAYDAEARTRICPDVRYRVYFKDLKIGERKRKYLVVGRREIEVTGRIKRKMLHDLREYPTELRRQLLNAYRNATRDDGTFIPVRKDVPIHRVVDILHQYVREAAASKSQKSRTRPRKK